MKININSGKIDSTFGFLTIELIIFLVNFSFIFVSIQFYPKSSSLGRFNYYVITKCLKFGPPSPLACTCSILVIPSPLNVQNLTSTPPPTTFPTTAHKNSKFCDFIVL